MTRFFAHMCSIALAGLLATSAWAETSYSEGAQYKKVSPAQPTTTEGTGKVEVVELFWYGCPHCYRLEPLVDRWLKKKPANVEFVRVPGVFRPEWEIHARAFYAAQVLGVSDKVHTPIFEAIHEQKRNLSTDDAMMQLFAEYGVSNDEFKRVFHSFAVETKVRRARDLSQRYGAEGVPTLIVNGKYRTSASEAGSAANIFNVVDYLVKQESATK